MRRCGPALLGLLLGACAGVPTDPGQRDLGSAPWEGHRAAVDRLQRWSLRGRVALHTPEAGWQAGLVWTQMASGYSLRIMAPLGQGTYGLDGGLTEVALRTPDNRIHVARDPEALLQRNLGWSLPVSGLHYWVRGIPDPRADIDSLGTDASGRLTELQQSGWHIRVREYGRYQGLDLPKRIFLDTEKFKVRIAIERWDLG